jgi:hypothetical protein
MNLKIVIESHNQALFKGKLMSLPFRKAAVIQKSIELFDDDDPCVIHQSYVAKTFAQAFYDRLRNGPIVFAQEPEWLEYLELEGLENAILKER